MIMILLLCALLAVFLGGGLYAYRIAFYSPLKNRDTLPPTEGTPFEDLARRIAPLYKKLMERPCEFVTICSHDGLTLSGRYYHVRDGAPLDIGFHGYRSSAFTDFAGGSELSFQMEHNLLLVDQRAHGKSEGRSITFGIQERHDVLSWVEYAVERFGGDTEIVLYGVSMGAATVLMASNLDFPCNVKGIVADCPYSSPMEIILHVGRTNPLPQWLIRPFVIFGAKVFGGFDILETDAARAVKESRLPILIIHGTEDGFVPCAMSEAAYQANPGLVSRVTFPNADHALSYLEDTPRYHRIVAEFMEKILQ